MLGICIIIVMVAGVLDGIKKLQGPATIKSSNNLVEYLFIDY